LERPGELEALLRHLLEADLQYRTQGRTDGRRGPGRGAGDRHLGFEEHADVQIRFRIRFIQGLAPAGHRLADHRPVPETPATIDRVPDPAGLALEVAWDEEWDKNLMEAATDRIKRRVDPKQYQIFDLHVFKGWSVSKVARTLNVNPGRVYLAKHRITHLIKKEIHYLQTKPL
jgi:DNA-directed RNA polymerase specialized sigma24 family protein